MERRDTDVRGSCGSSSAVARLAAMIMAVLAAGVLAGCGPAVTGAERGAAAAGTALTRSAVPQAVRSASQTPGRPARKPMPEPVTPSTPTPAARPVGLSDAGSLPQTQALPRTTDTAFKNLIHDFWLAVTTGKPAYARPAFFPEKAYEQVKAIADPSYDWRTRLWYDFTLDLAAVHPLVGEHAKLVRVIVPAQYALWVPPGACYNSVGYWHIPGTRVVYEQGGVTRSFGIASLISWRGDWYLIHLGALVRATAAGVVDDPETGPGVPGPPGGC